MTLVEGAICSRHSIPSQGYKFVFPCADLLLSLS